MSSLVLELQRDAMSSDVPVSQLLRKAKAVSVKLDAEELSEWISCELGGYPPEGELPSYREVNGTPMVSHPLHGWQPVHFEDGYHGHLLSKRMIVQPIAELEELVKGSDEGMYTKYTAKISEALMSNMGVRLEPVLKVGNSSIVRIFDGVRNAILEWALELEKRGILGDEMEFSSEDKSKAGSVTYTITNNIGSMHASQLQQASESSIQIATSKYNYGELASLLSEIQQNVSELTLSNPDHLELCSDLKTILAQIESERPKDGIISTSLDSLKSILEAASGNVIAAGYLSQLGTILS